MKKTYIQPTVETLPIATISPMVTSVNLTDDYARTGGPGLGSGEWDPSTQGDALGKSSWSGTNDAGFDW